ncbi:MAG: peptidoglycan-associated lipoprotein Pal [Burkholderiales bacterium]|nr:peptidoglycan-associated lipoprotein Pal [Burkholderiales bacterium]
MNKFLIAVIAAAVVAGCQTAPTTAPTEDKSTESGTTSSTGAAGGTTTQGTQSGAVTGTQTGAANPLKDPSNILSRRSIYFEFDSFTVSDQFKPLVEAHAKYLAQNRNVKVTLQGHADERGSREYNIALGQKRADAVKRMLVILGAPETIVETVSFGEEKPKNAGHDEASWAENRRVDIVYAGE